MAGTAPTFHRDLGRADFTLLVIGAVIGADVYVVASLGAAALGPAQIVAWLVAGVLAALIAFAFIQCAAIDTDVGGSYSYARTAFGPFLGFVAGWALYVGEWVALPVFPLAFTNYLQILIPDLPSGAVLIVKVLLIGAVTLSNLGGVRQGARLNDLLTVAKLVPLACFILFGLAFLFLRPDVASDHLSPFVPLGWHGFSAGVLPIFWAYAGFELAVLPAAEVRNPSTTLPIGLLAGMVIAIAFYLLIALVVVAALPWQVAGGSTSPLADAMKAMLAALGASTTPANLLMGLGAIVSIAGVYEVFTLGVARLSYALALDGTFPFAFARLHPRYGTPYVGLFFQAGFAVLGATLFDLKGLITTAVFFLGITYFLTACAAFVLVQRNPSKALGGSLLRPALGLAALGSLYLSLAAPLHELVVGTCVMAAGIAIYTIRGAHWNQAAALRRREHEAVALEQHVHAWLIRSVQHLAVVGSKRHDV
jgi:APA family basic amino acid/polyamine antiporter